MQLYNRYRIDLDCGFKYDAQFDAKIEYILVNSLFRNQLTRFQLLKYNI